MDDLIQPRTLKGFRDYLPELMMPRERLMEQARKVYRSYGFAPIDTPALEYAEILMGKGGEETDKQLYRFTDHGGRDVALRFDLTVPFARFAAEHLGQLGTPFKRYHLGPVWRGENTQRGRYREFWQCDFDIIGTTSNAADIEVALVIHDLMKALGFDNFLIHVSNRLIFNGILEEMNLTDKAVSVLRALDKLGKIGEGDVVREMVEKGRLSDTQAWDIVNLVRQFSPSVPGISKNKLEVLRTRYAGISSVVAGVEGLEEMFEIAESLGNVNHFRFDLSIARGLDYYTGTIYETFLTDLRGIGSVCSGGRYDNLASLYTKQVLPGVGASLGLDRLLAAMEELNMLPKVATPAAVLLVQFSADRLGEYQKMARDLRAEGIGVEVYPEARKVGQQLQYAERRGFRVALIAGPDESAQGVWKIKDLARREEITIPTQEVAEVIRRLLERADKRE
jgi:histidyl-tRNA synthetase